MPLERAKLKSVQASMSSRFRQIFSHKSGSIIILSPLISSFNAIVFIYFLLSHIVLILMNFVSIKLHLQSKRCCSKVNCATIIMDLQKQKHVYSLR